MFINPYKKGRIRSWVLELARIDWSSVVLHAFFFLIVFVSEDCHV